MSPKVTARCSKTSVLPFIEPPGGGGLFICGESGLPGWGGNLLFASDMLAGGPLCIGGGNLWSPLECDGFKLGGGGPMEGGICICPPTGGPLIIGFGVIEKLFELGAPGATGGLCTIPAWPLGGGFQDITDSFIYSLQYKQQINKVQGTNKPHNDEREFENPYCRNSMLCWSA